MSRIFKRLFSRRTLVRLLFGVAALATLLVVLHLVENFRGRRAWNAYATAALAEGRKLDLKDYIPPPVPDAENYAAIPLFQDLFATAETGPVSNALSFPKPEVKTPGMAAVGANENTSLAEWQQYFVKIGFLEKASENAAADVEQALGRYEPYFEQLRRAGERPRSHFPVKWELGFSAQLPHLGTAMNIGKLLRLLALAQLEQGKSAEAYATVQQGLSLYRALRGEPALINGLVRIALLNQTIAVVQEGLRADRWKDKELALLTNDIDAVPVFEDLIYAMESERAGINNQMEMMMEMPAREITAILGMVDGLTGKAAPMRTVVAVLYPRGWIRQNQVALNRMFDSRMDRLQTLRDKGLKDAPKAMKADDVTGKSWIGRLYYPFAGSVMPVVDSVETKYLHSEALVQQAAGAIALQRYHHAQNGYPERLEQLVPDYAEKVPRDPIDGAPMRYRRSAEDQFELWSIALNGVDDGGEQDPKIKKAEKQGDWVWSHSSP